MPSVDDVTLLPADTPPSLSNHRHHARSAEYGHGRPSFPLLSIFFAEFDNTVGPKMTCQAPAGFLSEELFEAVSDFMITGPELCHKLVTVAAFDYTIIGYPMSLSHKKYHRNALLFNIAFVFPRDVHAYAAQQEELAQGKQRGAASGTTSTPAPSPSVPSSSPSIGLASQSTVTQLRPYHAVIRKLATIIESLEVESEFLYRPESKAMLAGLIRDIFAKLNAYGECSVPLEFAIRKEELAAALSSASTGNTTASAAAHTALSTAAGQSKSATALPASSSSNSLVSSPPGSSSTALLGMESPIGSPSLSSVSAAVSSSLYLHHHHGSSHPSSGAGVNEIRLKLYPLLALPPRHVPVYLCPLPVKDLEALWKSEWDLTLRQVIPFMDGVNSVSRIALSSGIHLTLVTKCVRQLLYYQAVQLVDIFQFSNRYTPTEALGRSCTVLGTSTVEERDRVHKLQRDARTTARLDAARPRPRFSLLFRILSALGSNTTLAAVLSNLDKLVPGCSFETSNIHPRKLVQFALINGLIRRVYLYPVLVNTAAGAGAGATGGTNSAANIMHSPSLGPISSAMPVQPLSSADAAATPSDRSGVGLTPGGVGGPSASSSSSSSSTAAHSLLSSWGTNMVELGFLGLVHGRHAHQGMEDALQRHLDAQKARAAAAKNNHSNSNSSSHHHAATSSTQQHHHPSAKGMFSMGSNSGSATGGGLKRESSSKHDLSGASAGDAAPHPSLSAAPSLVSFNSSGSVIGGVSVSGVVGGASAPPALSFRALERFLDGEHHFDELCCLFGRSFAQVEEEIRRSKRCIIIAK